MNRNGIADTIRDLMRSDFLGHKNAKPRSLLLGRVKIHEPKIGDRTVRRIYGQTLPVGWCDSGIYVIDDIGEVEKMIETESRRRDSIGEKIEMLELHRRFLIVRERERQSKQMRLFG